jgi:hypothetical protein
MIVLIRAKWSYGVARGLREAGEVGARGAVGGSRERLRNKAIGFPILLLYVLAGLLQSTKPMAKSGLEGSGLEASTVRVHFW